MVVGALAIAAAAVALIRWNGGDVPRPPYVPPPRASLARTHLHLHRGKPVMAGVNAVWCATVALAWDALADAVAGGRPLDVGPPANEDDMAALSRARFPVDGVGADATVVVAGRARDGVVDRFVRQVRARWNDAVAIPNARLAPDEVVAMAALAVDLPFPTAFAGPWPATFVGAARPVRAFGVREDAATPDDERRRAQIHPFGLPPTSEAEEATATFAVELVSRVAHERVLLARMPRPATLEAAWGAMATLLQAPAPALRVGDGVEVPRVMARVERAWDAWRGAPIRNATGGVASLGSFVQRVDVRLEEHGAHATSAAIVSGSSAAGGRRYAFDRPFLLALAREGAAQPYLLAWIENDDLLEAASDDPRGP